MLSAQGTVSQTNQSNGKMSDELIYLSQQVMMPMKDHFLFIKFFLGENITLSLYSVLVCFLFSNIFDFIVSCKIVNNI